MRLCVLTAITLALLALVVPRAAEAGACARPAGLVLGVVPSETDVIPRGEAVLLEIVGASQRSLGAPRRTGGRDPLEGPFAIGARLERRGRRPISIRAVPIAPGLARFVPSRPPEAGTWQLVAQGQRVPVVFGDAPAPPLGGAPELLRVERRVVTGGGRPGSSGGRSSTSLRATLRQPIDLPWRGLLAFDDPRAESLARVSRPLEAGQTSQLLYATPGRCSLGTPGESPPSVGQEITVALYDLYGRVSARSSAVQVVDAP